MKQEKLTFRQFMDTNGFTVIGIFGIIILITGVVAPNLMGGYFDTVWNLCEGVALCMSVGVYIAGKIAYTRYSNEIDRENNLNNKV
jgi:hypothetical protein